MARTEFHRSHQIPVSIQDTDPIPCPGVEDRDLSPDTAEREPSIWTEADLLMEDRSTDPLCAHLSLGFLPRLEDMPLSPSSEFLCPSVRSFSVYREGFPEIQVVDGKDGKDG